jgi:hypothetical protein
VSTLAVLMHLDSSILRAVDVFGQTACHFAAWTGRSASASALPCLCSRIYTSTALITPVYSSRLVALEMIQKFDPAATCFTTRAGSTIAHLAALK